MARETLISEIQRAQNLEEELKRREGNNRLKNYKPFPKQELFHQSKAKVRVALGSNRSGKTEMIIAEAIAFALGERPWDGTITRPAPNKVLIGAVDFSNAVNQYIWPKIKRLMPKDVFDASKITYLHSNIPSSMILPNGTLIKLASYEQEVEKFEGADWDLVALDEICSYDIYVALYRGTIDRGGRIVMALTPRTSLAVWVFEEIYQKADTDPDIFSVTMSIYENPTLSEKEIESFRKTLTTDEIEARIYGKFRHLMGRVFTEYDPDVHVLDWKKFKIDPLWPKGLVVDPHDRKPFAMLWFTVNPQGDLIFFREWPDTDYWTYTQRHSLDQYVKIIQEIEVSIPGAPDSMVWRLMDPNFGPSPVITTGRSVAEEFGEYGLFFDTKICDEIPTGHIMIQKALMWDRDKPRDALNRPKLYITDQCRNTNRAFLNYIWDPGKMEAEKGLRERVKGKFKDYMDCIRYVKHFDPTYFEEASFLKDRKEHLRRMETARLR